LPFLMPILTKTIFFKTRDLVKFVLSLDLSYRRFKLISSTTKLILNTLIYRLNINSTLTLSILDPVKLSSAIYIKTLLEKKLKSNKIVTLELF